MESGQTVRSTAPSADANNQDVFIWALYLLGGADKDVDVEDIYLKSFKLAPARLGWRTRPDLPDYKKTAKALQSIEASTHVGLVLRVGPYTRRLTAEGVRWVEKFQSILSSVYSGEVPVRAAATNEYERRRNWIAQSAAYASWRAEEAIDLFDAADAFECSAASPASVWRGRLEEARRAADVLHDDELANFVESLRQFLATKVGGWK